MVKCYNVSLPYLEKVYDAGTKYRIGVYVAVVGGRGISHTEQDVTYYVKGVEEVVRRFHKKDSFVGIDLLDEGIPDTDLTTSYFN